MEQTLTLPQLSKLTGYSYESLLNATRRSPTRHPLPCTLHGEVRPIRRVRMSDFQKWEDEEYAL